MNSLRTKPIFYATFTLLLLTSCNNSNSSESRDCDNYKHAPVLFVHGSGLSSSSWGAMIAAFLKNGYPRKYLSAIDLLPRDGDNITAARYISGQAKKLLKQSQSVYQQKNCPGAGPVKIDIVSHSMGAVSSRWYVTKIAPQTVRIFISLAGSNHGTNALCGRAGKGDQQMCPAFARDTAASSFQIQLNGSLQEPIDETPYGLGADPASVQSVKPDANRNIIYYSVRLEPDRWITPSNSAVLEGAGGLLLNFDQFPVRQTSAGNLVFTANTSHDELPAHNKLIELVYYILSATQTSKPGN